jgi:SCY1-like protein 1
VRDQAFKAVELFVKKLESHAATMVCIVLQAVVPGLFLTVFCCQPETAMNENGDTSILPVPAGQATLVNSAAGAAGALAGWAISSLGKKVCSLLLQ